MGKTEQNSSEPYRAYIPNTREDQQAMLRAIGIDSADQLFEDIPSDIRYPTITLPRPLTEMELMDEMQAIARKNIIMPSFLGYGTYRRFQPSIVRAITGRDEFLTSYTPYQPEISQGTLQTAFEYQSMMAELYGMDVSNTGMYDGATAMAEAALMAVRIQSDILKSSQRRTIVSIDTVHPNWIAVTRTYLSGKEIGLRVSGMESATEELSDAAALIVQSPNFLGNIEDLKTLGEAAHANGALFIVVADPISLGLFKSPGEYGADIAVGEGQSLGNPTHLGGVNLGIFTTNERYIRQMPGRIVGRTVDEQGRTGYVLTLQPREQHIRRERATSNICTAEQLVALAVTVYLAALGPRGLRRTAELNYHNAHYLARKISSIPRFNLAYPDRHFFNEFVVQCPASLKKVNKYLIEQGIIGGKDVSDRVPNGMLLCATEMTSKAHMDQLIGTLAHFKGDAI